MAYLDVIPLLDAKDYLGIDDLSRDSEITRMIEASLKYIEKRTNYVFSPQNRNYTLVNGCVRVYDWPINTLDQDLSATITRVQKPLYSIYTQTDENASFITLNVGSITPDKDLIEAAYILLEHYFQEEDRGKLPKTVEDTIQINRRFIL